MSTTPDHATGRLPRQIGYIIGNEGCERFSFYGMRNILTPFLITTLLLYMPEGQRILAAKDIFHTFVIGVYFFPLLGGWLSDRFFGKYNTVLWMSLIYCAGHINFGSFFASLLMPLFLHHFGAAVAFGIPGGLMFIATVVFWLGRRQYVMVPPGPPDRDAFSRVIRTALLAHRPGQARPGLWGAAVAVALALASFALVPSLGFVICACIALVLLIGGVGGGAWLQMDRARGLHPDHAVDGARNVLRVLVIFALTTPFFSLFDQKASTWVVQGGEMTMPSWFVPAQMQALNPLLVMLLIPFNNFVLYPLLRRLGHEPTALRRMTAGIAFSGLAWIVVGGLQMVIDGGDPLSIVWQVLPYALLTFGEVLVSATGLEFAYSQAPASMKGVVMSFWNLTTTIGNLWVLLANAAVRNEAVTGSIARSGLSVTAFQMFFFAAFALLAALAFGLYARRYREVDNYRSG